MAAAIRRIGWPVAVMLIATTVAACSGERRNSDLACTDGSTIHFVTVDGLTIWHFVKPTPGHLETPEVGPIPTSVMLECRESVPTSLRRATQRLLGGAIATQPRPPHHAGFTAFTATEAADEALLIGATTPPGPQLTPRPSRTCGAGYCAATATS